MPPAGGTLEERPLASRTSGLMPADEQRGRHRSPLHRLAPFLPDGLTSHNGKLLRTDADSLGGCCGHRANPTMASSTSARLSGCQHRARERRATGMAALARRAHRTTLMLGAGEQQPGGARAGLLLLVQTGSTAIAPTSARLATGATAPGACWSCAALLRGTTRPRSSSWPFRSGGAGSSRRIPRPRHAC